MNGCSNAATVSYQINVNPLPSTPVITQVNDTLYASGSGSFQWYLDGIIIPGATNPYYVPAINGNYTVTVSDTNSCESISVIYPMTNVGLSESTVISLQVFPNPSTGLFQLMFENTNQTSTLIQVIDPAGREIVNATTGASNYLLNLLELADGIYFLKIQPSSTAISVTKIIKQSQPANKKAP